MGTGKDFELKLIATMLPINTHKIHVESLLISYGFHHYVILQNQIKIDYGPLN